MGLVFALASMVFAGINDLVFKEFTNQSKQSQGVFLSGIGFVSCIVFGTLMFSTTGTITGNGWLISLGAGAASFLANVFFVRSFRVFPAGTGATIYRLNLVVVAILSFFWLNEPATPWKVIGIVLGSAAVLTLGRTGDSKTARITFIGFAALIIACLLRALMGILYKFASNNSIPPYELLAINGAVWCIGGLIYAAIYREPLRMNAKISGITLLSGILVCGITYFMLAATSFTQASIVIPITQMSFIVTCFMGALLYKEAFTSNKVMAVSAAIGCVICLSQG